MERFDFTLHSPDQRDLVDSESQENNSGTVAVIRQNFLSPIDFIGDLRVTRFKISAGALPLLYIKPSTAGFVASSKAQIDVINKTPTDIAFGFIWDEDYNDETSLLPTIGGVYTIPFTTDVSAKQYIRPLIRGSRRGIMPQRWSIVHVFINEKPQWREENGRYYLINNGRALYNWYDLYTQNDNFYSLLYERHDNGHPFISVFYENNAICFKLGDFRREHVMGSVTTPQFFCSSYLAAFSVTTPEEANFSFAGDVTHELDPWFWENNSFYTPCSEFKHSMQVTSLINKGYLIEAETPYLDMNTIAEVKIHYHASRLNPFNSFFITCDELNFDVERICVNTKQLSGVVNPSALAVFKTFVVGTDNNERSDFVLVDDSLTQYPLKVDNPRTSCLTLRFFILTKENNIIPMYVPPGESIFIQLSLVPAYEKMI